MSIYKLLTGAAESWSRRCKLACVKTHTLYTRPLGPDSVVVDLGANVGQFSEGMYERFGCNCYAVEAMPNLFEEIPANEKVRKFNLAVSDSNGPLRLFTSSNRECNSLFPSIAESYGLQSVVECPGLTLETFLREQGIDSLDVLKVDIEGAEKQVFGSTSDELLRSIKQITIEFHDFVPDSITSEEVRAIRKRLEGLGFLCIPFSYLYPTMKTADFLFLNRRLCPASFGDRLGFQVLRALLGAENLKSDLKRLLAKPPTPVKAEVS